MATVFWDAQGVIYSGYTWAKGLCRIIGRIRRRIAEKNGPGWPRKKCSSTVTTTHLRLDRIALRTAAPSYSPGLAPRDFFVFKFETSHSPGGRLSRRGGHSRNGDLLCRLRENVFFRRAKEVGASSLGQVYGANRGLC